jgi:hypothetical protein
MKIFVVGLPRSGRSTVAKALMEAHGYRYIDAMSWVRSSFRKSEPGEHPHQYEDAYQLHLAQLRLDDPWFVTDYIVEEIHSRTEIFVIDGLTSPKDFVELFDYQRDIVVFLNRTDNEHEYRDHENIGVSVIRDYCFWMSAAGLLRKERWLEYNFKIPGEASDHIKVMGAQNSVFIVKSITRVISHLIEKVKEIVSEV